MTSYVSDFNFMHACRCVSIKRGRGREGKSALLMAHTLLEVANQC